MILTELNAATAALVCILSFTAMYSWLYPRVKPRHQLSVVHFTNAFLFTVIFFISAVPVMYRRLVPRAIVSIENECILITAAATTMLCYLGTRRSYSPKEIEWQDVFLLCIAIYYIFQENHAMTDSFTHQIATISAIMSGLRYTYIMMKRVLFKDVEFQATAMRIKEVEQFCLLFPAYLYVWKHFDPDDFPEPLLFLYVFLFPFYFPEIETRVHLPLHAKLPTFPLLTNQTQLISLEDDDEDGEEDGMGMLTPPLPPPVVVVDAGLSQMDLLGQDNSLSSESSVRQDANK